MAFSGYTAGIGMDVSATLFGALCMAGFRWLVLAGKTARRVAYSSFAIELDCALIAAS